jgi:hypothetical protein
MFKFFFVIPAKTEIQWLQTTSRMPGLGFATPGMTDLL